MWLGSGRIILAIEPYDRPFSRPNGYFARLRSIPYSTAWTPGISNDCADAAAKCVAWSLALRSHASVLRLHPWGATMPGPAKSPIHYRGCSKSQTTNANHATHQTLSPANQCRRGVLGEPVHGVRFRRSGIGRGHMMRTGRYIAPNASAPARRHRSAGLVSQNPPAATRHERPRHRRRGLRGKPRGYENRG